MVLIYGVLAAPVEDDPVQEFENGNRMFSAALYKELVKETSDNIVISPLSLDAILSLTYEGAIGETAAEFVSGLHLPNSNEKVQRAYRTVLPKLESSSDTLELLSANRIYIAEDVVLEDEFSSIAANVYRSGVAQIGFSDSTAAADEINRWVEEETNQKVRNLIDSSNIDANTRMVLVNTLYLSGQWRQPFQTYPEPRSFYRSKDDAVYVTMMLAEQYVNYWKNDELNARFVELPLQGANISMVIALPNEVDGLADLENNVELVLRTPPKVCLLRPVEILLPRFSVETKTKFVPVLQNLGIQRAFSRRAQLSGISSTDKSLYVTDVIQKTYLNVTEGGIEAAAATEDVKSALPDVLVPFIQFEADRPFLYYIRQNGVILFSGRYVGP
ncbi:hypothetical protein NQ318_001506 [Aromia moschata]|uniref:Serpin domain-containing protein n=1 Tax=Aromia moschata TaxID=1265417 RepID=A0AAV8Y9U7_9CUCU|nr:hypothetical protein NQ318_001506 [Aromia moschata]